MKKYLYILILSVAIIGCESDANSESQAPTSDGQGGSLARFTLKGNYLYTVDDFGLNVFNVADTKDPIKVNSVPVGFNIETLFGYKDYLYIGSQNGMFIYDLENPEFPKQLSSVEHFTACDPVIANDTHAFVTLHSNTNCGNDINVLEVYDVTDVTNPILLNSRNLTFPKGLGLYGNYLFVCDDEIKVFDVTNPEESKLVTSIKRSAFDVIIRNDLLIAIGESGLYQYELSNNTTDGVTATEISSINI
ncbi:hypothetical protein FEE95_19265 [Maribacter algarum]|uniref:LVIVD repeat-containing protein n=1 Tax=Maribacter algarum (ex Zhang et al. 2020) TaxID=2578118 RepID=A0A5S3PIN2_9FLAO|nr:hypothetical protein [Maribacter algarum]TMM53209.1 hypothetical protein FEE95_19265 [Maribacter algarum]